MAGPWVLIPVAPVPWIFLTIQNVCTHSQMTLGGGRETCCLQLIITGKGRSYSWLFIQESLILSFNFAIYLLWLEACSWPNCWGPAPLFLQLHNCEGRVRKISLDPLGWLSKSEKKNCLVAHEALVEYTDRVRTFMFFLLYCCSQHRS